MRRTTVYVGAVPLEVDILNSNKNAFVALGHVLQDMLGTSTLFSGLGCVPTSPAGMTVNVNPGRAYSLQATDNGAWSSLSADSRQLVKQGILLDAVNFSCPAPTTAGFSINYLIQGAFQEVDGGSTVLPYYNASNPAQAYNGPNGTGTSNTTYRDNTVQLQVKAGVAATTGSQITPTPDAGFNGLWVITVAFGATTITSGNIVQATNAPILPADLLHAVQASSLITGTDTGAANACVVNYSYPVTALTDGMVLWFKAKAANTGATTLNVNGLGAQPVVGGNQSALQGGEFVANGKAQVVWNATISSFVLLECTGAALQVAPATQSQHAVQMAQAAGVVGSVRNLSMSVTTASATATLTADEIIVETALGGVRYCLPSFSKTINLATTGAGGMDTGSAPVSGFVAIYAIWNPTTSTAALLARTEGASAATTVYSGANLPAGYTASALVGVWPTNASSQFVAGYQRGSRFYYQTSPASLTNGTALSPTAVSVSALVPKAALDYTVAITGVGVTTNSSGVCSLQTFVEAASGAGRQQAGFLGTFGSGANSISFAGPSALMPNVNQSYLYATSLAIGTSSLVSHAITDYKVPVGGE